MHFVDRDWRGACISSGRSPAIFRRSSHSPKCHERQRRCRAGAASRSRPGSAFRGCTDHRRRRSGICSCAIRDARDEDLPDARRWPKPHDMAPRVPEVEIADTETRCALGAQTAKWQSGNAFDGRHVGAKNFPDAADACLRPRGNRPSRQSTGRNGRRRHIPRTPQLAAALSR